ncbi:MAG: hypothetical protein JST51_13605 [Armatimonadetes bacterium]|nr:hypothetical protein [Armatimonadota bacterium]
MILDTMERENGSYLSIGEDKIRFLAKLPVFESFLDEVEWLANYDVEVTAELNKLCVSIFGREYIEVICDGLKLVLSAKCSAEGW